MDQSGLFSVKLLCIQTLHGTPVVQHCGDEGGLVASCEANVLLSVCAGWVVVFFFI